VAGIHENPTDPETPIDTELALADAERLVASLPAPQNPFDTAFYLQHCVKACQGGVERSHILPFAVDGALLMEIFTHDGIGNNDNAGISPIYTFGYAPAIYNLNAIDPVTGCGAYHTDNVPTISAPTINIVPTPIEYWICTTFKRERMYRSWFLETNRGLPLLQAYETLAAKFPMGLADVPELPEELSGAVNAMGAAATSR